LLNIEYNNNTKNLIIFEKLHSSKYGVLLNGIIQELRNLFIKASSIFKLFFTILDDVIFDMNIQSEIELLIKGKNYVFLTI